MAVGDRISTSTAVASGPVAALTAMLHERGIGVEMVAFHQIPAGEQPRHSSVAATAPAPSGRWVGRTITRSALRAVIACANRLLTAA